MKKIENSLIVLGFCAFLSCFFLANLLTPDRESSHAENRVLQGLPRFSFSSLFSGSFTRDCEDYCADQFVLRDGWISLKAQSELLLGKRENNGVFLCEDGWLIKPFDNAVDSEGARNIQAVNALSEKADVPVTLALIPSASEVYASLLPSGAPNDSQRQRIDELYARSQVQTVDLLSPLLAAEQGDLYYHTDHHWTTLGAFYAYRALSESLGYQARELEEFTPMDVYDRFYGTSYSSSGFFWVAPDIMQTFCTAPAGLTSSSGRGIYLREYLTPESRDQYSYFLGGNTPELVLDTGNSHLPSLLLIRDSFSDALAPFFLEHYSKIHLLDLRYYRSSPADYIRENDIDQVLVIYGLETFCTDKNIPLLAY